MQAPEQQHRAREVRVSGVVHERLQGRQRPIQIAQLQRHSRQGEPMRRARGYQVGFQQDLRLLEAAPQLRVPRRFQIGRGRPVNQKGQRKHRDDEPSPASRYAAVRHPVLPMEGFRDGAGEPPSLPLSADGARLYIRDFRPRKKR